MTATAGAITGSADPADPADSADPAPLVRVERGHLTDDELAALTAVLMARAAAVQRAEQPRFAHGSRHPQAHWRRLERVLSYRSPVSWR